MRWGNQRPVSRLHTLEQRFRNNSSSSTYVDFTDDDELFNYADSNTEDKVLEQNSKGINQLFEFVHVVASSACNNYMSIQQTNSVLFAEDHIIRSTIVLLFHVILRSFEVRSFDFSLL